MRLDALYAEHPEARPSGEEITTMAERGGSAFGDRHGRARRRGVARVGRPRVPPREVLAVIR
jgi:hypothetical protein